MALVLANLLTEYRSAIRNTDEADSDCYSALNSVKDEFQSKTIEQLGANALNTTASELSITLTSAYSYSLAAASPTIGRIIEVKLGDGTHYRPMRQTEGLWTIGMQSNWENPEYRINGNYIEIKFQPSAGNYIVIVYAPTIYPVSDSYTGSTTFQSYQIDEVDRAWCRYAAMRHFEDLWEDEAAARQRNLYMIKLLAIKSGGNV